MFLICPSQIISGGLWAQNTADQSIVDFQKQDTLTENSKIPEVNGDEFTILTAKFWSNWLGSGARRSKLIFRSWKNDKEFLEPQLENAAGSSINKAVSDETDIEASTEGHKGSLLSARESLKAAVFHFFTKWHMHFISFWKNAKQFSQSTFQLLVRALIRCFLFITMHFVKILSYNCEIQITMQKHTNLITAG